MLVNVYVILFIEDKNRNKNEKKAYHSYHCSLGYYLKKKSVPPASAIICRPDFPFFSRCKPPDLYSIA